MKKVIAIFTIFSFLIYITSCYSYKNLSSQEEYNKYSNNKNFNVLSLQTNQGEKIEFNEKLPAKILSTHVVGLPKFQLSFGEQDSLQIDEKTFKAKYIWKNGINYKVIMQDTYGFICHKTDTTRIPFSNIEQLRFKKYILPQSNYPKSPINIGIGLGSSYGNIGIKTIIGYKNSGLLIGLGSLGSVTGSDIGFQISYKFIYLNLGYGVYGCTTTYYFNPFGFTLKSMESHPIKGTIFNTGLMISLGKRKISYIDLGIGYCWGGTYEDLSGIIKKSNSLGLALGIGFRLF